jgi:hypothetical protein
LEENIHIIPLGYEIDRVVKPFEGPNGFRANRVYLLSTIEGVDAREEVIQKHTKFVDKVKSRLEGLGIAVEVVPANLINILELLSVISGIVKREVEGGNHVYINMSGAGRLTSVASTLAGMVHDATVYYVESDDYADLDPRYEAHGYTIVDKPRIVYIENFKIELPNGLQTLVLSELSRGELVTEDLIGYLKRIGVPEYSSNFDRLSRSDKSKVIMRLDRGILAKLVEQGYVTKRKVGRRSEYGITESGRYVVSISGLK